MRIHNIDRHLYRVEMEAVFLSRRKHPEMHCRILVSGKSDVANLARFTGGNRGLKCSTGCKNPVRIFHPNDLVELDQVDDIGLQPSENCSN